MQSVPAMPPLPAGSEDLADLVSTIVDTHHTFARTELARLFTLADALTSGPGPVEPEVARIQELLCALADDLLPHMLKEERVLFPYLVALERAAADGTMTSAAFGSVSRPIDAMHAGHQIQLALLRDLRLMTSAWRPPRGATTTLRGLYAGLATLDRDLLEHIRLENDVAFPRAEELERLIATRATPARHSER